MTPLRILHVTPYYEHAWAYGGIPRVATALAAGLAARGHQVTVCTTDASHPDKRLPRPSSAPHSGPWTETDANGVHLHVFPNLSNAASYHLQLFLPRGFRSFLAKNRQSFDVAHIHACHNVPGAVAARWLRRAAVPYVLQPHGTAPRIERRHAAKYLFDVTLGRPVLDDASLLLAVTEAERRQLTAMGIPSAKISVVPNPIALEEFARPLERGAFRRRFGLGNRPLVTFLGKLTPRKRLDVLAHAFARLNQSDARLVVAGNDMGYGRQLDALVKALNIANRTIRTGLLTGRERLEALADADVVVYASKDEIFGLVPIEALLCGTPVIVADDSGCAEVVAHLGGGMIVRQGDTDHLASAIAAVLDAPEQWRAAAAAARRAVPPFCGTEAVCARLERVYADVAGHSSAHRALSISR
jgi:glycosyltransferase involved in cell wall biosynthesis